MAAKASSTLSPSAAVSAVTCVQIYGEGPSECGYCKSSDKRLSFGVMSSKGALPAVDYQALIDVGWRRSGCYLYRPNNFRTCCPNITIKLDCTRFEMNKAQRRVLRRFDAYLRGESLDAAEAGAGTGSSSFQKQVKRPSQSSAASELPPLFAFISGLLVAAAERLVDHLRKRASSAETDDGSSKDPAGEAPGSAHPSAAALDAALAAMRSSSGTAVAAAPARAPAPPLCGCRPQLASSLALKLYGLLKARAPGGAGKAKASAADAGGAASAHAATTALPASAGPASLATPAAVAEALLRHVHDVYLELTAAAASSAARAASGAESAFVTADADASAAAPTSGSQSILRLTPPPAPNASSSSSGSGAVLLCFAPSGHINIALPDGGTAALPSGHWCPLPAPATPSAAAGAGAGSGAASTAAAPSDGISPAADPPSAKRARATDGSAAAAYAAPAAGGAGKGLPPKSSAGPTASSSSSSSAAAAAKPLKPRAFTVTTVPAAFSAESHALYKRYQMAVHGDTAEECSEKQFTRFLCDNPLIREPFPPTAPAVLRTPLMAAEEEAAAAAAAATAAAGAAGGASAAGAASSSASASAAGFWAEPQGKALSRCVKGLAAAWRDGEGPGAGLPLAADAHAVAADSAGGAGRSSAASAAADGDGVAPLSVLSSPAELAFPALRLKSKLSAASASATKPAAGGAGAGVGASSTASSSGAPGSAAGAAHPEAAADADDSAAADQHGADLRFGYGAFHQHYRIDGKLVAVGVVDILPNCLSSVYVFYDPELSKTLELGKLTALWEIAWVQRAMAVSPRLKHYYLGYYIRSCTKMRYKVRHHDAESSGFAALASLRCYFCVQLSLTCFHRCLCVHLQPPLVFQFNLPRLSLHCATCRASMRLQTCCARTHGAGCRSTSQGRCWTRINMPFSMPMLARIHQSSRTSRSGASQPLQRSSAPSRWRCGCALLKGWRCWRI